MAGSTTTCCHSWLSSYWQPFIEAAAAAGVERIDDHNGAEMEGVSLLQITTRKGRRHSAADAFLKPVRNRDNLKVETGAHARRILIEGGRVVGVQHAGATVRAAREVILAAGAYGSPRLLMLSGSARRSTCASTGFRCWSTIPTSAVTLMIAERCSDLVLGRPPAAAISPKTVVG